MRAPHHRTLNRQQVHRSATKHLQEHVPLRDYKALRSPPVTLWAVIAFAAAELTSIHASCQRLEDIASEETIRKALYASLPEFAELQRQLLCGHERLPRAAAAALAAPGDRPDLDPYRSTFGSQSLPQSGQRRATCLCHHRLRRSRGQRFTVALTAVTGEGPSRMCSNAS